MFPRDFSKQLRSQLASGLTLDTALRELRSAGASIIESIIATKSVRGCDLAEAKRLIHDSTTWADVVERTDAMWAQLDEELDRNAEPCAAPNDGPATRLGNSKHHRGAAIGELNR
jgi:hypothetical protein